MVRDALVGLLLVAAAAALSLWLAGAPDGPSGPAAAGEFDNARALEHIERLAARPRPPGSEAHRQAERYVVEQLTTLGLETEVQEATAVSPRETLIVAATVRNVVARLRGSGDGTALLLVAHYDSRPHTPGAGDDAAGVAALLETVRVVTSGPGLRNDLIVLVSDAEEVGLLGAEAFAADHRWMEDVAAVVNFEGRGNRGASVMFETGPGSAGLVRELARSAPAPVGNSLSTEIYERMPNDTDFSVFKRRDLPGLNFAFIGRLAAYHSALDRAEALDPSSLRHHGTSALALARSLGDADLGAARRPNPVYFNPIGSWMVVYPAALAPVLALIASGLLALAVVRIRRRARGDLAEMAGGFGGWLGVLLLAPVAVWVGWNLLGQLAPGLRRGPNGATYVDGALSLAASMLVVAVAVAVFSSAERRSSRSAQMAGILAAWAVPAVASAWLLPGASFLFVWPLLIGAVLLLWAIQREPSPEFEIVVFGGAALVPMVLFAPTVRLLFEALTLEAGWVVAIFVALPVTFLGPLLAIASRGRAAEAAIAIAVAAVAIAGWASFTDRVDEHRPRTDGLFYLLDGDTGAARWVSPASAAGPATERLGEARPIEQVPGYLASSDRSPQLVSWEGPVADLQPPTVRLVDDSWEDGVRVLTLGVSSPRGGSSLWISARCLVEMKGVRIDGRPVPLEVSTDRVRMLYFGLAGEELLLGFEMTDRQPVELEVADQTFGLPEVDGAPGERASGTIVDPRWISDSTLVATGVWN